MMTDWLLRRETEPPRTQRQNGWGQSAPVCSLRQSAVCASPQEPSPAISSTKNHSRQCINQIAPRPSLPPHTMNPMDPFPPADAASVGVGLLQARLTRRINGFHHGNSCDFLLSSYRGTAITQNKRDRGGWTIREKLGGGKKGKENQEPRLIRQFSYIEVSAASVLLH